MKFAKSNTISIFSIQEQYQTIIKHSNNFFDKLFLFVFHDLQNSYSTFYLKSFFYDYYHLNFYNFL
jgi:hypothetical protein